MPNKILQQFHKLTLWRYLRTWQTRCQDYPLNLRLYLIGSLPLVKGYSLKVIRGIFNENALAEGVGFEPTELSLNGFQDRRLKPLGHPSGISLTRNTFNF